jgi:hypothetical protein
MEDITTAEINKAFFDDIGKRWSVAIKLLSQSQLPVKGSKWNTFSVFEIENDVNWRRITDTEKKKAYRFKAISTALDLNPQETELISDLSNVASDIRTTSETIESNFLTILGSIKTGVLIPNRMSTRNGQVFPYRVKKRQMSFSEAINCTLTYSSQIDDPAASYVVKKLMKTMRPFTVLDREMHTHLELEIPTTIVPVTEGSMVTGQLIDGSNVYVGSTVSLLPISKINIQFPSWLTRLGFHQRDRSYRFCDEYKDLGLAYMVFSQHAQLISDKMLSMATSSKRFLKEASVIKDELESKFAKYLVMNKLKNLC